MKLLPHRLRQLRKERGWTLKETEEKSSVPLSYLSAIENGRRQAGRETLKKLATAFGGSPAEVEKLLEEFEQCRQDRTGISAIGSPFGTIIDGKLVQADESVISSFDVAQEIDQLLLVLGGRKSHQLVHDVVARTDREISADGSRMSRGYVVKHEDSEFFIEISVSRKQSP